MRGCVMTLTALLAALALLGASGCGHYGPPGYTNSRDGGAGARFAEWNPARDENGRRAGSRNATCGVAMPTSTSVRALAALSLSRAAPSLPRGASVRVGPRAAASSHAPAFIGARSAS